MLAHGAGEVVCAVNGVDAFKKLETFSPDLILLDIEMPEMDGLEFCEKLRRVEAPLRDVSVVVMTGLEKMDDRVRALHLGISGLMHKPIQEPQLLQNVHLCLQKRHLMKKLLESPLIQEADLDLAKQMQSLLLPDEAMLQDYSQRYHMGIQHLYRPSEAMGGDYWMMQPINNHIVAVCVADFSGHGVMAAINTFRLHTFLKEYAKYYASPAEVLKELNGNLHRMLPTGEYLTCFLGFIDMQRNILQYAAAAVPPAVIVQNGKFSILDCSGEPLGAYDDAVYHNHEVPFVTNSTLFLYSDALVERNGQDKILFTATSLLEHIGKISLNNKRTVCDGIIADIDQSGHHFDDDLTLLCLSHQ